MQPYIISGFPGITFSENAPDFTVGPFSDSDVIHISATLNGTDLFRDVRVYPDKDKNVTIRTKQLVRNYKPQKDPNVFTSTVVDVLLLQVDYNGKNQSAICRVLSGGIDKKVLEANWSWWDKWASSNFLTWQPQVLDTTPEQPQRLHLAPTLHREYKVESTLYLADGRKVTKTIAKGVAPYYIHEFPTDFNTLWAAYCNGQNVILRPFDVSATGYNFLPDITLPLEPYYKNRGGVPVAYDVFATGYEFDDNNTPIEYIKTFVQRYELRAAKYNDVCFGFYNTLGGFDTLMMQGQIALVPAGEVGTFTNTGVETELTNDYTSCWEASTGYIDNRRMAAQYQDFLKSTERYIYREGKWLKIIVAEYKIKDITRELNAYTFKYRLAEKNERRYYERTELPELEPPVEFCGCDRY